MNQSCGSEQKRIFNIQVYKVEGTLDIQLNLERQKGSKGKNHSI